MAEKLYVSTDTAPFFTTKEATKRRCELLWGDTVTPEEAVGSKKIIKAKARGASGYIKTEHLNDKPLLEIYFIDVGQGDGILIVTPERKHIMIDGGFTRSDQLTKRNAADFIDWKFNKDYGVDTIKLNAMISSHNDADHYGGLWDLINVKYESEMDCKKTEIDNFYYAGMNWFEKNDKRNLGPNMDGYWTPLLNNTADLRKFLDSNPSGYQLQGEWKQFIQMITAKAGNCQRISQKDDFLPGFGPSNTKPSIKILAPIEEEVSGNPALKKFGKGDAQNTNGHSILLRVDYGKTRILLTGDLNAQSQKHILNHYTGNLKELACDVVKACHHGSDDCSYEFLSTLSASATIISSGDNEGHNHPRPKILAASALTGHLQIKDDNIVTPLIYSTEISRSYKITHPDKLQLGDAAPVKSPAKANLLFGSGENFKKRNVWNSLVVTGIIYGLVNVRTDGNKILCATLSESKNSWDTESFMTRFI
jgi:beta-lactamase superfamily II metal-dependent hydrolase